LGEHDRTSGRDADVHPVVALARAILLAPLYFILLTIFGLWPLRFGSPFFLVRPLRIPQQARNTFVLRMVAHRLLLRDDRLLRDDVWISLSANRLKRWLRSPWFVTYRYCARFTRSEMERTGRSGASVALSIYCNSLVDSYRYANGTVHRDWFDLERRADGAFHLPNEHHIRVCCYLLNHKLNPDMPLSQRHYDKAEFHRICEAHKLPTIPVYAVINDGKVTQKISVPDEPMISKPVDLAEGNGVFTRWTPVANGTSDEQLFSGEDGKARTLEEVFDELVTQSRNGPYLLQRQLFNHTDIRALSGVDTLCTLRVPTCRFPDGKVMALPLAFIRLATTQDAAVDNLSQGSIAYPVAVDTGILKAGGKYSSPDRFTHHPATGSKIAGVKLPYWKESLDLCKAAHATAFPSFATLGWDVAITPHGPRLVEMNIQWIHPAGLPDEPLCGQTAYVDCILAHIRHFWPEQLPPPKQDSDGR